MDTKLYKLEYLNSISGGDIEFVHDMIKTFVTNSPLEIRSIREKAADKNWLKTGEETHRFASSLLLLGLDNLHQLATDIENKVHQNQNIELVPSLLEQLELNCNLVITQLKNDFNV